METIGNINAEGNVPEEKKKRIRLLVARTVREKRADVVALMKEYQQFDDKNRGAVISTLVNLLKNNDEFRQKFADIVVARRRDIKKPDVSKRAELRQVRMSDKEARKETGSPAANMRSFSNADGATLVTDIKEVFQATSEAEMECAVNEDRKCILMKWVIYGAVAVGVLLIIRKL